MSILLFDNDCGLCSSIVVSLGKRSRNRICYVPLQSEYGEYLKKKYKLSSVESAVFIHEGEGLVRYKSEAIVSVLSLLPFPLKFFSVIKIFPRFFRDWAYDLIAKHRHRFTKISCPINK